MFFDRSAAYDARTIINWTPETGCPNVWFTGPFTLDVASPIHLGRDIRIAVAITPLSFKFTSSECGFSHPGSRL